MNTAKTNYNFEERGGCPVCCSTRSIELYSCAFARAPISTFITGYYHIEPSVLSGAPYELRRCLDCSLVYQSWVGDPDLLGELYGVWIEDHYQPGKDPSYAEQVRRARQTRDGHEIMVAARFLGLRPTEMATLDYGMGWALWARIASELGCKSYGSDLAPSRMRYASGSGIRVLEDKDIGQRQFHFINTEQVMEHLARPREVAERLAAALIPGGILKVSVPSAEGVDAIVRKLKSSRGAVTRDLVMPVQPLEHVNSFTRRALGALARAAGLEIVEPSLAAKYAFLGTPGAISLFRPAAAAKELIRPHYQFHNSRNLYVWMRKPMDRRPHES